MKRSSKTPAAQPLRKLPGSTTTSDEEIPFPRPGGTHLPPAARCCPAPQHRLSSPSPSLSLPSPPFPALPQPLAPGGRPAAAKVGTGARWGGTGEGAASDGEGGGHQMRMRDGKF